VTPVANSASRAAWQLARRGIAVELLEMRPHKTTPAHRTARAAELVCTNSFKSDAPEVVRSIIHLAGTLGMTTVAEGIERPEQVARLRSLGAEFGQGFLFARPLTEDQLADYLTTGQAQAAT